MLFGVGIFLGCLVSYVIFYNNRDYPAWLPNDRMTEKFMEDSLIVTDLLTCYFNCWGTNEAEFKQSFRTVDVNFSESIVRDVKDKIYNTTIDINGQSHTMEIISRENNFELRKVLNPGDECKCN